MMKSFLLLSNHIFAMMCHGCPSVLSETVLKSCVDIKHPLFFYLLSIKSHADVLIAQVVFKYCSTLNYHSVLKYVAWFSCGISTDYCCRRFSRISVSNNVWCHVECMELKEGYFHLRDLDSVVCFNKIGRILQKYYPMITSPNYNAQK